MQIGVRSPSKNLLSISFQITQKIQAAVYDPDFPDGFSYLHRATTSVGISILILKGVDQLIPKSDRNMFLKFKSCFGLKQANPK